MGKRKKNPLKNNGKIIYYRCGDREYIEINLTEETKNVELGPNIVIQSGLKNDVSATAEGIKKIFLDNLGKTHNPAADVNAPKLPTRKR